MAVFAILTDRPSPQLGQKIAELYPDDEHFQLTESQWLISTDKLTKTISDELGIKSGEYGRAIVLRATASGSGFHKKSLWEWLKLQDSEE